ncbi:HNH endonuclease signature motif containing protein [Mycobacterium sp. pV006]|uniref:HNH endonuclease signature motif containing protein n=1 Tax=Mycobacterium sp. pV006 TaxID=3238983 RepID=UPI00351BD624
MFDTLANLDDGALLTEMSDALRHERRSVGRRLVAAGRLTQRRIAQSGAEDTNQWCIDNWDLVAAEVGAELGVSRGRASSQMGYGLRLLEAFPKLAEVVWNGDVDYRVVTQIDHRTGLVEDPHVLALLDEKLAAKAPTWNALSRDKTSEAIDWLVSNLDPEAVRRGRQSDDDRYIDVNPGRDGMAYIEGAVRGPQGLAFDKKLDQIADTVCRDDPRTRVQRRADAVDALTEGVSVLPCLCGSEDCPAGASPGPASSQTVVYVLAEQATVDGVSDKPGFQPGVGAVPAANVAALAKTARVRKLPNPESLGEEPQYRPSAALAAFVRFRDMTCRWPGCGAPAARCDIDHTIPYPFGPTHPSNCKLYCRRHHLVKTFFSGSGWWRERQLPDGTMEFISPTGRRHVSKPFGALLFPQLAVPTGTVVLRGDPPADADRRTLAMPLRRRSRAAERAYRIEWERNRNRMRFGADPPPF